MIEYLPMTVSVVCAVLLAWWRIRDAQRVRESKSMEGKIDKILNAIKELITSSSNSVFLTILYIAAQIDDIRAAFTWLMKTLSVFDTKRANAMRVALIELSEDLHIRKNLLKLLKAHIRLSSLEDWLEALKEESRKVRGSMDDDIELFRNASQLFFWHFIFNC